MADVNGPIDSGLSFANPQVAIRARDAIRKIAKGAIQAEGSNPNVGRVMAVDIARLKASVWFPGDDSPTEVGILPGSIPLDLGDYRGTDLAEDSAIGTGGLVYVEDFRGKPYITRILSGGEYTLDQRVAGLTHQMFNATELGTRAGPPVQGIYERHVNIFIGSDGNFTTGKCLLIGPWAGKNDGSQIDGIVEIVLSFIVEGDAKECVRKYEFSVSDRQVVDIQGDEDYKSFWMRVLPNMTLQTMPHAEMALDVALVKTGIRSPIEFWIRLVPLDTWADQSEYRLSVKTYGSAFNVGDPKTGRIVKILRNTVDPIHGYLGFNQAGMGFTERDGYASWPNGVSWSAEEWSTGPYRAAPLRAANDLRPLWRNTGQWFWNASASSLFWEGNIVFTGIGANFSGLPSGSLTVGYPVNSIPLFPGANFTNNYRSVAGGIVLNPGETLYYGLCPGMGASYGNNWADARNHFFIVDSKTWNTTVKSFALPEWAIPIATRTHTLNGEARDFFVCNPVVDAHVDDQTRVRHQSYTVSHNAIVALDETETLEIPSFRYRAKQAYRLSFRCGISSAAADVAVNFRFKKGALATSPNLGESYRIPIVTTGVCQAAAELLLVNDTNADITTVVAITGQSSGPAGHTWNRFASTLTPSYALVEWAGPAARYALIASKIT